MDNILTIRRAVATDIERIGELLYQVHMVHSDARPDLFKTGAKKYTDEQLSEILKDENKPVFVATRGGSVCGYAFCIAMDNGGIENMCNVKTLYIDDLCVDEKARGGGIGKALFDHVVEHAKANDFYNVTLNVWADNENAVAFYKKIGLRIQKIGMEKIL